MPTRCGRHQSKPTFCITAFVSRRISSTDARLPQAHPVQIFQSVRADLNVPRVSWFVVALPRSSASRFSSRAFSFGSRNSAFSGQGATIQKEAEATTTVIIPSIIKILQSQSKTGTSHAFSLNNGKLPSPSFISSYSIHLGEQISKELYGHQPRKIQKKTIRLRKHTALKAPARTAALKKIEYRNRNSVLL